MDFVTKQFAVIVGTFLLCGVADCDHAFAAVPGRHPQRLLYAILLRKTDWVEPFPILFFNGIHTN